MSFRSCAERAAPSSASPDGSLGWGFLHPHERDGLRKFASEFGDKTGRGVPDGEARRLRRVIEAAVGDVFGIAHADISQPSRGKAPVARARQVAMYLAHVSCGLSLTDVGIVFARDRTTVAHACAVIEDLRDDPVFDRALELMEWIVPTLAGRDLLHTNFDS